MLQQSLYVRNICTNQFFSEVYIALKELPSLLLTAVAPLAASDINFCIYLGKCVATNVVSTMSIKLVLSRA